MSAQEALDYGLIDEIVSPDSNKLRMLNTPPPSRSPLLSSLGPMSSNEGAGSENDVQFGNLVRLIK